MRAGTGPSPIVSIALFMVVLDNLVVTVALPSIRRALGASIQSLEWTVNAYMLAYAVLLLTGAALGDRFGRKRMFIVGLALFTASSAGGGARAERRAADRGARHPGRRRRDRHAADADPARRGLPGASGAASRSASGRGSAAIAVALGPLVGGAVIQATSWHWIFWINVPIGLVLCPLAGAPPAREPRRRQRGSTCPASPRLEPGCSGSSSGSCARSRWAGAARVVLASLVAGALLLVAFVAWELRAPRADAADGLLRPAQLRRHERRLARDVLRHVRLDLLPQPVPAERAPQHARCRPA